LPQKGLRIGGERPIVSVTSDAIELPNEFVGARDTQSIEHAVAVVFIAGIDVNGVGVGDRETVGRLRERRERRIQQRSAVRPAPRHPLP
jgi:hypothetical protein